VSTGSARRDAFKSLYLLTHQRLYAYAYRRASSSQDAADAYSETYAIAWKKFEQIPEGFEIAWLYNTCRYVLFGIGRETMRMNEVLLELGSDSGRSADVTNTSALEAREALGRLKADDREVLMLVAWDGLDSHGLGTALGCSEAAARVRLHRARRNLAKVLGSASELGDALSAASGPDNFARRRR
jgi:RNA polymerase sigma-70 factor, ECF subfamily